MSVKSIMSYAESLAGVKYRYYGKNTCPSKTKEDGPFWLKLGPPPSMVKIKKGKINCSGLANLMRRKLELDIPGKSGDFPGCSGAWFEYLQNKKRLQKIDLNKSYPYGTLLLKNYNSQDQGHLAVVFKCSSKGLKHSKIIHAKGWGPMNERMVVIEKFSDDSKHESLYTHICLPKDWIKTN
jgi:hypothetical protein